MAERCRKVADSGVFQGFILGVIVLNAITLGIQTYDISSGLESALSTLVPLGTTVMGRLEKRLRTPVVPGR